MPIVDPSVAPTGSLPPSPIGGMMSNVVGILGQNYPTAIDRARMNLEQAQTAKTQQETQGAADLGQIFQNGLAKATAPVPNDPNDPGKGSRTPTNAEVMTKIIPSVADSASRMGHPELTGALGRTMAAYLPGAKAQDMTMPMLAAGQSYAETPEMLSGGNTPAARDRAAKINNIVSTQGVDANTAAGIVDGVTELTTDQNGQRVLVNKATGANRLIYSPQPNTIANGPQGFTPPAAPSPAPAAPGNNPGNLRAPGQSTGFQSYPTPQAGMDALQHDLTLKLTGKSAAMNGQTPTLRSLISTYSPPNENNTPVLIAAAAKLTGLNPDAPLDQRHLPLIMDAILSQEDHGGSSAAPMIMGTPAAAPFAPATQGRFEMKPGDLGVDFGNIYGGMGGGVQNRVTHMVGSVMGNNEPDPALADMSRLNNLKAGLTNAMALMPGRSANSALMKQLLESVPDTTSDVGEDMGEVALNQARINPADAETKFNQLINQAASARQEAYNAPYLDPKVRDTYMTVVHSIDSTLKNALPPESYARYAASNPGAPPPDATPENKPAAPAAATNLQQGQALTAKPGTMIKVISPVTGKSGKVPAEELPRLLKLGYKVGG